MSPACQPPCPTSLTSSDTPWNGATAIDKTGPTNITDVSGPVVHTKILELSFEGNTNGYAVKEHPAFTPPASLSWEAAAVSVIASEAYIAEYPNPQCHPRPWECYPHSYAVGAVATIKLVGGAIVVTAAATLMEVFLQGLPVKVKMRVQVTFYGKPGSTDASQTISRQLFAPGTPVVHNTTELLHIVQNTSGEVKGVQALYSQAPVDPGEQVVVDLQVKPASSPAFGSILHPQLILTAATGAYTPASGAIVNPSLAKGDVLQVRVTCVTPVPPVTTEGLLVNVDMG
jgi:hypothetical protein